MGTLLVIILVLFIIFLIIYNNKIKENSITKQEQKNGELVDIDNIVAGYEYSANLWTPHTSLEALNHHGEKIYLTPENELPNFGDSYGNHGVWLPLLHNDRNSKPTTKKELRELEFLKKFRKTYESDLSHEQKFEIISKLLKEYHDLPSHLLATDWYLWELMEISGISLEISSVLYFKGIKTKQDVKLTSDKELLTIPGIGQKRLMQIRAYFSTTTIA